MEENTKRPSKLSPEQQLERIQEICQQFVVTNEQLIALKDSFLSEIRKGLKTETNEKSSIKCWPTFIHDFPTGCEHGMFLVIQLGGSRFCISCIHLKGAKKYSVDKETYDIANDLYSGDISNLFDYIVECLFKFVKEIDLLRDHLNLAFCVVYSLRNSSENSAKVKGFTKNTFIPDLLDQDIVEFLQEAINRRKILRITVTAVLNECTAILLACNRSGNLSKIGVNLGTSCNATYMERIEEIELLTPEDGIKHMLVNVEWGDFGQNGQLDDIYNEFDEELNAVTRDKDSQKYIKMTSGFYLGELARQVFVSCIKEGILFEGQISEALKVPFSFSQRYIIDMLSEEPDCYDHMRLLFDKLGIGQPDDSECIKVHHILNAVTERSAYLVTCGILSLMEKINDSHIIVAIGGNFFFNSRIYNDLLEKKLKELVGDNRTFELKSDKEAVAVGSAVMAAIVARKEFLYESEEMKNLLETIVVTGK